MIKSRVSTIALFTIFIAVFSREFFYFSFGEGLTFGLSSCVSFIFLSGWYRKVYTLFLFFRQRYLTIYLASLPILIILFYVIILKTVASWDVVDANNYILLYVVLGIAWVALSLEGMLLFLSFSYIDDALLMPNKAALYILTGGIIGSSLIYAGANVGDGPGFWTVLVAAFLGTITWLLFAALLTQTTQLMDQIISEHQIYSGLRFLSYLVSMAIILANASSGDWLSFRQTLIDFLSGWPVVLFVSFAIFIENVYFSKHQHSTSLQLPSLLVTFGTLAYSLFIFLQ